MTQLKQRPQDGEPWVPLELKLQSHPYSGKLIVFEGVDGAGKTSLITALSEYLRDRGQPYLLTKTPTDDVRQMWAWRAWSDGSYNVPRAKIHGYGLSIIAFGDRLVHQGQVVEPALKAGKWVLCDRYILTSVAYESGPVHKELAQLLIRPDLGIVVDVIPEEALRRIRQREHEDEHPSDSTEIPLLRERYLRLARLNGHIVISTTSSTIDRSLDQLYPYLERMLKEIDQ